MGFKDEKKEMDFDSATEAYLKSLDLLKFRDHSEFDMKTKLMKKGFSESAADAAVNRLVELNFINNERYAHVFISSKETNGWAKYRIEHSLLNAGINVNDLPGYPEDYYSFPDDYSRAVRYIREKRSLHEKTDEQIVRHLASKGYGANVSYSALREFRRNG